MHLGGNRHWLPLQISQTLSACLCWARDVHIFIRSSKKGSFHHFHSFHYTIMYITNSQWPTLQLT